VSGVGKPLAIGTRLYLTTPSGERVGFTFAPTKHEIPGAIYYTPSWVADTGVNYTLYSTDAKLTLAGGKFYDLLTAAPYNPSNGSSQDAEYVLVAKDGTNYELDAQRGLVGRIAANGTKLIYSDSGILADTATAESVEFIKDSNGRIAQITAPDGTQLTYEYDSQGDLVSVSNSGTGKVEAIGYDAQGRISAIVNKQDNTGIVLDYSNPLSPLPLPPSPFLGGTIGWTNGKSIDTTSLTGTQYYSFELRDSELKSTPNGTVLVSTEGSADAQINGSNPVYTNGNYRIFAVDKIGINLLKLTSNNLPATSYELRVIGDANHDGKVDGVDAALVTNAFGKHSGDIGYDRAFDLDRNGTIDAKDLQLLGGNYGFSAAPAVSTSTRPGKLGSVRKTPGAITLSEGNNLITQTTQRIKLSGTGQHLVEFDVDTNFDLADKTSATTDRLAVYLVDPNTDRTILDRGESGSSLFSISELGIEHAAGLVKYQGSHIQIDVGSLKGYTDAELVFQLINNDRDTNSTVSIKNFTETLDAKTTAATLTPKLPQLVTLGGAIDLTGYTATTNAKLLVSDVAIDSTTGKYVANVSVRNTGTTNLPRNLAVLFPNLPAGVTLTSKSGTDANGNPYLNFQQAIEFGGLLPSQESAAVRITLDDPALAQFVLAPMFLAGAPDVAPTLKSLEPISVKPGERFTTDLIATDPNGVPISIGLQDLVDGNAAGLSVEIDNLNRLVIVPSPTQIGTHSFTLVARQGNLVTTQAVTVNVIPDPITDTRVSGVITGTDGAILSGVSISVGNTTVTTDAAGKFTLTLPAGETASTLKVAERFAPVGVSHSSFSTDLKTLLGHNLYTGANNQLASAIRVSLIDYSQAANVDSTHQSIVTNSQLPQAALTIASGSLVDGSGQPTTAKVSLSEVPLSAIPAALPDSFYPDTLISVTFSGDAKLSVAAAITAPNRAKYAPDTKLNLWKLDANTGEFVKVGKGVVTPDGKTVKTIDGGVFGDGIYTYLPEPVAVVADADNPFSPPTTQLNAPASVPINSQANLIDGTVTDSQEIGNYQSMGTKHTFTLHYNSQWADPTRFLNGQTDAFKASPANYNRLMEKWVIRNGNSSIRVDGAQSSEVNGIHGGEHFYSLPGAEADGKILTTPFTKVEAFKTLTTGVYEVAHTLALVEYDPVTNYVFGAGTTTGQETFNINRSSTQYGNADFGAGWSLGEVQELLLTRNDGQAGLLYRERGNSASANDPINIVDKTASVGLVGGDGLQLLFRPAKTIVVGGVETTLTYTSPAGDFSKFVKNLLDGTYTRTLKDGTEYHFDKWGQLKQIKDLNGNETNFRYDDRGHLIKITDPAGQHTDFDIDGDGRVWQMTAPGGRTTKFYYEGGNLIKIKNPQDTTSANPDDLGDRKWDYVGNHHIHTFTDEEGHVGTDGYDDFGRVNKATQRDGNEIDLRIAYRNLNVYLSTQNTTTVSVGGTPLAKAVAFNPDEFQAEVENAKHETQKLTLNKNGQVTKATDALADSGTKTTVWNGENQPTKTIDKYGNVTSYTYDDRGNVTDVIYDDVDTNNNTARIFSDATTSVPLVSYNKYGGVGNAIQVAAYKSGSQSIAIVGTSKSYLETVIFDKSNSGNISTSIQPLKNLVGTNYNSLQKLLVKEDSSQQPYLYVGYDNHPFGTFIDPFDNYVVPASNFNPGLMPLNYVDNSRPIYIDPNPEFYLRDNRLSSADLNVRGGVAKFTLGSGGATTLVNKTRMGYRISGNGEYFYKPFSVGDLDVGSVGSSNDDVVAINEAGRYPRLGYARELTDGKLLHISAFHDETGRSSSDDTGTSQAILIPGIDYFPLGYKIAVLDNGVVAATVPGKHQISLFKQISSVPIVFDWQELTDLNINTLVDITALDTIEIGGKTQLVYVDGHDLYLKDPTNNSSAKKLGIVGTSQAIAVGDIDMDGKSDIVVADYNQNLHVFLLNADGTVKNVQTSKINTKPRDIQIFDWNQDDKNDILIADGGSGLDIKINQYNPTPSTTPVTLLHTKFDYNYAPAIDGTPSDRIVQKTQTDIVDNQTSPTTRKTVSTYDPQGNLTQVDVTGSSYGLDYASGPNAATTHTEYNTDGTVKYTLDANNHQTKYTYLKKQVSSIERGAGTPEHTFEYYDYYQTGYIKNITDGRGNVTHYDYDALNRVTEITKDVTTIDPVTLTPTTTQNLTKTQYYKTGWVKSVTDANNHETKYEYDGVGRITKQIAADSGVTENKYNNVGDLESVSIKNNATVIKKTEYKHDAARRIIEVKESDGTLTAPDTTTSYEYAPFSEHIPKITTKIEGAGFTRTTTDTYDRFLRLQKSELTTSDGIHLTTENTYFDDGKIKASNVTGKDVSGSNSTRQTQYGYDAFGRQSVVKNPALADTLMKYDRVGNLTKMTDANGRVTDYGYDSLNRKTSASIMVNSYDHSLGTLAPNTLVTEYKYDENSNLIWVRDAEGRITINEYDQLNRQKSTTNAVNDPTVAATTRYGYDGVGNLSIVIDAENHHTTYGYDLLNRQKSVTNHFGNVVSKKQYDTLGRVVSSTNKYGEVTNTTYDGLHLVTATNSLGTSIQKTDAVGNAIYTKDAVGRESYYKYDSLNRQTDAKDYRGGEIFSIYDDFGNLARRTDASLNLFTYQYDKLDRLTNTKDSIGQISRIVYDLVGNKTDEYLTVNDGDLRHNNYVYDELNRQISMTTAVGTNAEATMRTRYDKVGNVVGTKDALGRITTSIYDSLNRQKSVTQAFGTSDATTSSYIYDKVGNRLEETNGRGYKTEYKYDALNRQTKVIDAYLNETKTQYFEANSVVDPVGTVLAELSLTGANVGKVIKSIDAAPFHNATYTLYDKFDRQIATYDATKHQTSATKYDAVDRVITATDTFGQNTNYSYAPDNRHTTTTTPTGVITTDTFDAANRRTRSDETASSVTRTTKYDYDERNRQIKITDASGGTTDYAYYNDGQTQSVTDAAPTHNKTEYFYDIAGRLTHENSPLGDRYYQYDLVNNRTQTTDRNGRKTDYTYDNLNRIKSEQWLGDGQTFTYSYDENGNRIAASDGHINYVYGYDRTDLLERVDRTSGSNPLVSFKYTYDEVGNLTKTEELIANAPTATTLYEYDDPRYLNTKITQTIGLVQKDVKFAYNPVGLNTTIERYVDGLLKVKTTNAYDTHGRLTGIEHKDGSGAVIANDIYVLDDLDRVKTQTLNGAPSTIGYDNTDQVLSVTGSNTEGYTYDLNGNRINTGYVTVSGNRLMSDGVYTYDYDPEGNRKSRTKIADSSVELYTWDYRNRLKSIVSKTSMTGTVTRSVSYEYDVDDQRVSKTVTTATGSTTEKYYLDGNQIALVTDGGGNKTFHYLYGLNVDSVLAQDSPSGMVWALADRLGSIDTLTDKDGVVVDKRTFDSFGRVLWETNPLVQFRYGYTGRERDLESGLEYYRARYYDSNVGRFISVDPMGFGAGDTNLYRYVGNSSTMATDPSGMFVFVPFLLGAIALGGAFGAGYAVADHLEKGGSLNNIDWQDTWEKATIVAAGAAVVTTGAAAIGAGLTAAGVAASTVQAGGLIFGAAGTGWSIGSGINNIANGKPLTGALDLIGAGLGIKGLVSGYQGYRQTLTNENIAKSGVVYDVPGNPRPISQVGDSQLNSTGAIVTTQSSALATTPPGRSLLPASSGSVAEGTSTIFRVQGGTPPHASRNHISFDSDGNPLINKTTLNISIGDLKHAEYFLGKRPGARIFSFEIPKWMDAFIQSEAIPQLNYNSNPANQNKLAPKIVDETTPGRSYELPSIWAKWLEETAIKGSGKITDKKN
jgi:RHS repeat-associated protein